MVNILFITGFGKMKFINLKMKIGLVFVLIEDWSNQQNIHNENKNSKTPL